MISLKRIYIRVVDYCIVFLFVFFFIRIYWYCIVFFFESLEFYDIGKCIEFDRKFLNLFIMNDVI